MESSNYFSAPGQDNPIYNELISEVAKAYNKEAERNSKPKVTPREILGKSRKLYTKEARQMAM